MKKKQICAILVAAAITAGTPAASWADSNSTVVNDSTVATVSATEYRAANTTKISLSLTGAYEKIKSSTTWKLMEAENDSDDAIAKGYSESVSSATKDGSDDTSNVKQLRVQRTFAQSVLETNASARESALLQEVFEKYYTLKNTEENVTIAKESLDIKQSLYSIAKKKYELGTVAKNDLLDSEISVMEAQSKYESAQNTLKQKQMEFNAYMGYNLLQEITLTDKLTESALPTITEDEAVKQALANRLDIKEADYKLQLQELNAAQYQAYPASSSKRIKAQISLLNAQIANETAAADVETDVRTKYMTMTEKYNAVQLGKKTVENAKESATIAQARYDAGMSTLTGVQEANVSYYNAQVSQASNLLDYTLAVENFNLSIGTGTSPISL